MLRPVRRSYPYLGEPVWVFQDAPGSSTQEDQEPQHIVTYTPLNPITPTMLLTTQRMLPLWLAAAGSATRDDSLLWKLLRSIDNDLNNTLTRTSRHEGAAVDNYSGEVMPRRAWMLEIAEEIQSVSVTTGEGARDLREALSEYDFLEASDAVYITDDSGLLLMRNLTLSEQIVNSDDKTYAPTGTLLEDERMYVLSNDSWLEIPHITNFFSTISNGNLTLGATGHIHVRCHTLTNLQEASGACITVNGTEVRTPHQIDLWNLYDELALKADVERITDEENSDLADRATHMYEAIGSDPMLKSLVEILTRLDLVRSTTWSGEQTLVLSDALPIQDVFVVGLPQVARIVGDTLMPDAQKLIFHSAKRSWYGDGEVLVNRAPLSLSQVTGANVTGGVVTFPTEQIGLIEASYSVRNWEITYDGTQATLSPTSNTLPGVYVVVYTVGGSITRTDSSSLTTAAANELADTIQRFVAAQIGDALWSNDSAWITDSVEQPQLSFVSETLS